MEQEKVNVYENMRDACKKKGTALTAVLNDLGKSNGSTGNWKKGKSPNLDTVMEIADHLHLSIDELVLGKASQARILTLEEVEWLNLFSFIPAEKRQMCMDFLRTHAAPEKYVKGKRVS